MVRIYSTNLRDYFNTSNLNREDYEEIPLVAKFGERNIFDNIREKARTLGCEVLVEMRVEVKRDTKEVRGFGLKRKN